MAAELMDSHLQAFLDRSPLAESLALEGRVVLARESLDQEQMEERYAPGSRVVLPSLGQDCVLELGGRELARGRVVRKGRDWYFQVREEIQ